MLTEYENELWGKGLLNIVGVDEVGRGPLAGPLVICAAMLDKNKILINHLYSQINDSKVLTHTKRLDISKFLVSEHIEYSIVSISSEDIDKTGMSAALQMAFQNSLGNFNSQVDHVLTDYVKIQNIPYPQTNITKGDSLSISIAAASILAKVYRDNLMINYHEKWPQYGFNKNKGYGTKAHIEAINTYGPCPIHRMSFKPFRV